MNPSRPIDLAAGFQMLRRKFALSSTYETKIVGNETVRSGVLLATDRRILFYAKKLGGYELESFPYKSVSSIEQSKSLMGPRSRSLPPVTG